MTIISSGVLFYIKRGFTYGEFLRVHPFTWDRETQSPRLIQNKWKLALWYLNVTFAYFVFVLFRAIQVNAMTRPDFDGVGVGFVSPAKKIYMQFATFYFLFPVLLQIMSLLQKESFPHFVRQLLNLAEILQSK